MEPNDKRRPAKGLRMKGAVLVRFTAGMLSPDSPEFKESANRPLSERGPNLPLDIEKPQGEQQPEG